ncbi:MAG: phage/plasmid primase, P4 family [Maribacter sp.]
MKIEEISSIEAEIINEVNLLVENEKGLSKAPTSLSTNKILKKIINDAPNVDFQLLAFPKIGDWLNDLKDLNSDREGNSKEIKALQRKIAACKLTKIHYLIHAVERLEKMASEGNWSFSKREGSVYLFNGKHWKQIDKEQFQHFLGNLGVKMGIPSIHSKHHAFKDDLMKQFFATYYLEKDDENNSNVVINLANGCFEISSSSQRLRDFRKSDFLNYQLPFNYDQDAKAPLFMKYLNRVLPSKSLQQVFFEAIAYSLTRNKDCKLEKMIILKGEGSNGKSVALDLIQKLLGRENLSNYSLSSLTNTTGYSRANIGDKLVNIASELSGSLESDIFKQLASGEPVEARKPYGEAFILHDYARFIFACNVLPQVEHTVGFFRRFLIIPFDVYIPKEERDIDLVNKIVNAGELSGIFNLVLCGLNRILKNRGFSDSEEIDEVGHQYKIESNSVLMFLEDSNYESSINEYVTISQVYPMYLRYCQNAGNSPFSRLNFQKTLIKNGVIVKRMNVGKVAYLNYKGDNDDF